MKTITAAKLKTLVSTGEWKCDQKIDIEDTLLPLDAAWSKKSETFNVITTPCFRGFAIKTCTIDDIKIIYAESFEYDDNEPNCLWTGVKNEDYFWRLEGVEIVDEVGTAISISEIVYYLDNSFSEIDYSALDAEKKAKTNTEKKSNSTTFTIKTDNWTSIRLNGKLVASTSIFDNKEKGENYSILKARWTELNLYKTNGGKFICQQIRRSPKKNERSIYNTRICETLSQVNNFFGNLNLTEDFESVEEVVEFK